MTISGLLKSFFRKPSEYFLNHPISYRIVTIACAALGCGSVLTLQRTGTINSNKEDQKLITIIIGTLSGTLIPFLIKIADSNSNFSSEYALLFYEESCDGSSASESEDLNPPEVPQNKLTAPVSRSSFFSVFPFFHSGNRHVNTSINLKKNKKTIYINKESYDYTFFTFIIHCISSLLCRTTSLCSGRIRLHSPLCPS